MNQYLCLIENSDLKILYIINIFYYYVIFIGMRLCGVVIMDPSGPHRVSVANAGQGAQFCEGHEFDRATAAL
jgi:hypothetical protein